MNGMIIILTLLFGGIAVSAGFALFKLNGKLPPLPDRAARTPSDPNDPWGIRRMRDDEHYLRRPGSRRMP